MSGLEQLEHLEDFETWLRSWGASRETVSARLTTIRAGLRDWPAEPSTEDLAAWLARPHLSPWSRVTYSGHVRSYFGWLAETGRREDNPAARLRSPRQPRSMPRPLEPDEESRVLAAAEGDPRLRAWLLLGLLAGLRSHEVAKLRGEDVSRDRLFVQGKGGSVAYLPVHPDLWAALESLPRKGWVFPGTRPGQHFNVKHLSTLVTRHFHAAGVEGSFHRCRHTYGTSLLRSGANIRVVQTLMRHEQLTTTARYLAVAEDERTHAVMRLALR